MTKNELQLMKKGLAISGFAIICSEALSGLSGKVRLSLGTLLVLNPKTLMHVKAATLLSGQAALAPTLMPMARHTLVTTKMANRMEKASTLLPMARNMLVNSRITKGTDRGFIYGKMAKQTYAFMWMTNIQIARGPMYMMWPQF